MTTSTSTASSCALLPAPTAEQIERAEAIGCTLTVIQGKANEHGGCTWPQYSYETIPGGRLELADKQGGGTIVPPHFTPEEAATALEHTLDKLEEDVRFAETTIANAMTEALRDALPYASPADTQVSLADFIAEPTHDTLMLLIDDARDDVVAVMGYKGRDMSDVADSLAEFRDRGVRYSDPITSGVSYLLASDMADPSA